jgi:hypothetical protein
MQSRKLEVGQIAREREREKKWKNLTTMERKVLAKN